MVFLRVWTHWMILITLVKASEEGMINKRVMNMGEHYVFDNRANLSKYFLQSRFLPDLLSDLIENNTEITQMMVCVIELMSIYILLN